MLTERIARFASGLEYEDLPDPIRRLARAQLLGWLGSVAAGWSIDEAGGLHEVAQGLTGGGEASVWPGHLPALSTRGASYLSAALSCANDYDDYLFLAHTGHSACAVPWMEAQAGGKPLAHVLTSMVAANEVMGRLGAACLVGPQNGQLWTFVHLAGAVIGTARARAMAAEELSRALSLAFFQPPHALWPGFGAASSKLLSASTPTLLGNLAVEHTQRGLAGAADALEGPGGFFQRFSFLPLLSVFDDLGMSYVTRSLSIKPVPGCAYVTAPITAAIACRQAFCDRTGRELRPEDVKCVHVSAGPMTLGMQRAIGDRCQRAPYQSEGVNFSVPLSVAVSLLHGRVDPSTLSREALTRDEDMLATMAARVRLRLDPRLVRDLVREVGFRAGMWRHLRRFPAPIVLHAVGRAVHTAVFSSESSRRSGVTPTFRPTIRDIAGLFSASRPLQVKGTERDRYDFAFAFGATVTLETAEGDFSHSIRTPEGAAGNPIEDIEAVAKAKFIREGAPFVKAEKLDAWADTILSGEADEETVCKLLDSV